MKPSCFEDDYLSDLIVGGVCMCMQALTERLADAAALAAQDALPGNGGPNAISGSADSIQVLHPIDSPHSRSQGAD